MAIHAAQLPMPRRVYGIETEYGITCAPVSEGEPPLDAEQAAQRLFACTLAQEKSTNVFLPNGARLYLDVGAHPEYASAECDQLADLLSNERAGDEIFAQMAGEANSGLESEGVPGRIHLFKNNLDSEGNSFGCHENYLIHRQRDFRNRIKAMVPFFVTRQILVGAGFISRPEDSDGGDGGARFEISPRAGQMWDAVSSASTRSRPMINTRDEPHGDPDKYRRMHVIVGDSNMSQSTLALKVGMTHALLSVMEANPIPLPDFELADPPQAIRATSADLSTQALLERANGSTVTALEIQREIHDYVADFYVQAGWMDSLSAIDRYVFELWERALTAFERGEPQSLATEIDWVAKQRLISAYQERSGIAIGDLRLARLELAWHDVTTAGLRAKLEATGGLRILADPSAVTDAMSKPPQTTRAKLRGDFIAAARSTHRDYMADWMNLRLINGDASKNVLLRDPFAAADQRVDELMEAVKSS